MKNQRGELLVWPKAGPIGSLDEVKEFESFIGSKFKARIEFVENLERKDGDVDVLIRYFSEDREGTEMIFRLFCVNVGIYPINMISRAEYGDLDSIRKFFK